MDRDPIRQKILYLLRRRDLTMREASKLIGRNVSYMHGFLRRGAPKVLPYRDAVKLAKELGCQAEDLLHPERPPRRKPGSVERKRRTRHADPSSEPLVEIPEFDVEASAGPGAFAEEHVAETARWLLPEAMIRHEAGATPDAVHVLRVRGASMEPELSDGDRVLVDTARRVPVTGEMFVLWDGSGLVVKRVEHAVSGEEPALRLRSANPDYGDYAVPASEVHIVGRVLWVLRRM